MKKRRKQIYALLCIGLLTLSMFAGGCGTEENGKASGGTASDGGTTGQLSEDEEQKELVEIRMVHMLNPEIDVENNPVLDVIEEKLGIRLIIEAPAVNDFWDRTNVMVATGDMPDFFLNGTDTNFEKWSSEGLLADITEDIKDYPNLMKNISPQQWGDTTAMHDGKIYGVPRCNSYDQWGFLINKAWLDKVGMEVPQTVDEFAAVCEAFTKNDPDGNGKNDTLGASFGVDQGGSVWNLYNEFFSTAYNISAHHGMPDKNGEYHVKQLSASYLDYMNKFREMYQAGIIDKEFITHKNNEQIEKFVQQKVGIVGASAKTYMSEIIEKYELDYNDYEFCAPLVLEKGDEPAYMMPPSNWCAFLINANTEKKADILRLLDWANSEEGFILTHLGIEGIHYNSYDIANRTLDRTEEQQRESQKVAGNMFGFANAYDGRPLIEGGLTEESTAVWRENTNAVNDRTLKYYAPFVKVFFTMQNEFPDETTTLGTLETRFITGEIQENELWNFIETEFAPKISSYSDAYAEYMKNNPTEIKK